MSSEKPPSCTKILPSQLRLIPHTTYYSNFFLLRTAVIANGQPAQIGCSSEGELTLSCRYPHLSLPLNSVQVSLDEVVKNYGGSQVGKVCCEEVPLFPVYFSSKYCLKKFLLHKDLVEQQLGSLFPKLPTNVKLQLFLVIPNTVMKDAQVREVTVENHSACMALLKESEMFDYWSLFQYRTGLSGTPSQVAIKDLVSELHDVVSWFQLGLHLDISPSELMKIRVDHRETDACKTEMLVTWLKQTTDATWSAVIRALVGIRMGELAQKVAVKYGVAVPSAVERKELQHFPVVKEKVFSIQSQLLCHVQQLHQEVEAYDKQLGNVTHSLEQAKKWREAAMSKKISAKHKAVGAYSKVKILLERKKAVGKQLQMRQRELKFLQQLERQLREREEVGRDREEGEREKEDLREILVFKDAEVRDVQKQLREVEKELGCVIEEACSLRKELQSVNVELAEKSAKVQELEKTKDKLEGYLDGERRRVDMLLMQSAASSKEVLIKEIKAQLSAAEKESNAITASEVGALKQTIADKDKEIEQLSGELQTLEVQLKEMGNSWSEKGEEVHRLMVKTLELNDRLVKVEGEKQERERRLEATHQQMEFLKQLIAELRKKCPIAQPDLQKCTASGLGLHLAEKGILAQFEVHLVDINGDPCTTKQQVTAELRSADGFIILASVTHMTPDTYKVSYEPGTLGRHELTVKVNDTPMHGSPFLVHARQGLQDLVKSHGYQQICHELYN